MKVTQFAEQVKGEDVVSKLKSIYDDALAKQSSVINITSDPHLLDTGSIRNIIESRDIDVAVITRSNRDKDLTFFLEVYTDYFHIQSKDFRINFPCQINPKWTEEVYVSPQTALYLYPHSNVDKIDNHKGHLNSEPEIVRMVYNFAVHILNPFIIAQQIHAKKVRAFDQSLGKLCEALFQGKLIDPEIFLG